MIWYYVINWNISNPVRWILNVVWLQSAILQNCGLHMTIYVWLQSFRIRHPFWSTLKSRLALKPCMQLGYKIFMNKKGAMVRDSNNLQNNYKADAALVDHMRLHCCFISPSIPVAPNAHFSVLLIYVTRRTRGGNRTSPSPNCHLVHQPQNQLRRPLNCENTLKWFVLKQSPPGPPILISFAKSNLSQT